MNRPLRSRARWGHLLAVLALQGCVLAPHAAPINPAIGGRLISAENGQPVPGAALILEVASDTSHSYQVRSDSQGRFAFGAHEEWRLFAVLADAPMCIVAMTVEAQGFRPRHCVWTSRHGCPTQSPPIGDLELIPAQWNDHRADTLLANAGDCVDPATWTSR
ncbi:carboxypeptidase-like regulatory domain-containing protein [Ectopseudomonas mendocina]|nr:carboxypeptidase-like regulatory domain-containing protein [Pseudomonas mendocina]